MRALGLLFWAVLTQPVNKAGSLPSPVPRGGTETARKLAPTSPPGQIALHWLWIHRVTREGEGDLKTPALPQAGLLAWVLGLRGQHSPRKRKMAPQL